MKFWESNDEECEDPFEGMQTFLGIDGEPESLLLEDEGEPYSEEDETEENDSEEDSDLPSLRFE